MHVFKCVNAILKLYMDLNAERFTMASSCLEDAQEKI